MRKINRGNALNRKRAQGRYTQVKERRQREAPPRTRTTGGLSFVEIREVVAQAIEKLPPKMRSAMILRYWEHLSSDDIAARMKIPRGTARWFVYQAAMRLHENLRSLIHKEKDNES